MRGKRINFIGALTMGFIVGVVWVAACGGGSAIQEAVADILYQASQIGYTDDSGALSATTVQQALDALAGRSSSSNATSTASSVTYDGTTSGMEVTTVQDAIDALAASDAAASTTFDGTDSGMAVTTVQDAIDALAVGQTDEAIQAAMGTKADSNPLNHDKPTASSILTSLTSVDGTGSLLDADLFDGSNSSAFVKTSGDQVVNGGFTASSYALGSAKNGYLSVPGVAFMPQKMTNDDETGEYSTGTSSGSRINDNSASAETYFAPIYPPQGSTITTMDVYGYDNNATALKTIQVKLFCETLTTSALGTALASVTINNDADEDTYGNASSIGHEVDQSSCAYVLQAIIASGASLELYGVRLTYTYDTF